MNDPNLKTGWDTALFVAPMAVLLFLSFFRLDAILSAPRRRAGAGGQMRRVHSGAPRSFCDPDGKPWRRVTGEALRAGLRKS